MDQPKPRYRCFACGRFTDEVTSGGPTADEAGQCERWTTGVLDIHSMGENKCRAAVACWPCFWRTDPDMWISPEQWTALDPRVPYPRLPRLNHDFLPDAYDPNLYPWPLEGENA